MSGLTLAQVEGLEAGDMIRLICNGAECPLKSVENLEGDESVKLLMVDVGYEIQAWSLEDCELVEPNTTLTFIIGNRQLLDMTPAELEDLCNLLEIDITKAERHNNEPLKEPNNKEVFYGFEPLEEGKYLKVIKYMHPTWKVVGMLLNDESYTSFIEIEIEGNEHNSYPDKTYESGYHPLHYEIRMGEVWDEINHSLRTPKKVLRWFMEKGFEVYKEEE